MPSSFSLTGKTIALTGASGVLGTALAHGLASAGAALALIARRQDALDALAREIGARGGHAFAVAADVLNEEQLRQAHKKIRHQVGPLDILINAAGGNQPGATVQPAQSFLDLDPHAFRQVVDLNLMGSLLPTQIFSRDLIERKTGHIINITSMAADRPLTRVAGYGAAKAAMANFTRWLAVELATKYGEGIRVNAVAPGFFLTEQNKTLLTHPDGSLTPRGQQIIAHTPFQRFGQPDELIGTVQWLCSDASRFVTGAVIPVDGGFSAYSGV